VLTLDAHPQNFYESGKVALESGITSSDLYYNVTGNGSAVQFSGGGTSAQLSGILLASFRDVHLLPGLIYWREIIGDSNILTLRSGRPRFRSRRVWSMIGIGAACLMAGRRLLRRPA